MRSHTGRYSLLLYNLKIDSKITALCGNVCARLISGSNVTVATRWRDLSGHPSGFDYARITLAASVLFWHSYEISYGRASALQFWATPFGLLLELILPMFFCLSGFLVFGSLERSGNIRTFLTLRIIRIYPALCVEVLISAFILGPLVTNLTLSHYIIDRKLWLYMCNSVGWIHFLLPGVFLNNPLVGIVNTSLWTVPYELECYIILPVLFWIGLLKSRATSLIVFLMISVFVMELVHFQGESGTPLGSVHGRVLLLCFLAGNLVYKFRDVIAYNFVLASACGIAALFMLRYDYFVFFAPVPVAYLTVYFGLLNPKRTRMIASGDYSYGLYLYAAPIQQTIAWLFGSNNSWLLNSLLAFPVTVFFAICSWHFVERPFLRVKRMLLPGRAISPLKPRIPEQS